MQDSAISPTIPYKHRQDRRDDGALEDFDSFPREEPYQEDVRCTIPAEAGALFWWSVSLKVRAVRAASEEWG